MSSQGLQGILARLLKIILFHIISYLLISTSANQVLNFAVFIIVEELTV